jgi:hypothetical protein
LVSGGNSLTEYKKRLQVTLPVSAGIDLVENPHYNSCESMYVVGLLERMGIYRNSYDFVSGDVDFHNRQTMNIEFYDPEAVLLLQLAYDTNKT